MPDAFRLIQPAFSPPLDPDFRPAVLANRAFQAEVTAAGGVPLVLGVERQNGALGRFETAVYPEGHPRAEANLKYAERLVKFLLWARGGWRLYVGGPKNIADYLAHTYSPTGERLFDYHFMGEEVYEQDFTVVHCAPEAVPPANESGKPLGRHLDGCRIGFDLGASDRKVSAVIDGNPVYSEEVVWEPRKNTDPEYHYREVIFKDSYLSGDKRWLGALMGRFRREIGVPFKCFATISAFDDQTARLLKEGGCYSIEFGLQTWNDRLRREILNRPETSEDARRVFRLCDQHRLWYDVDHMFHLPTETEEDHARGAECYRGLRYLGRIKVHHLVYHPTAEILRHAVAAGDVPPETSRRLADGCESDFYRQTSGSAERREVVAGYAALYKILPLVPGWLLRWLLKGGRVAYLRRIPPLVIAALQGVNALRSGDLRFAAYLQTYPAKVLHTLLRHTTARKRAPGASR